MGCGKSTVGPKLASRLAVSFLDLDAQIETESGVSIEELFSKGESLFRAKELEAIRGTLGFGGVVALGGGAYVQPEVQQLLESETVVFLDASHDECWKRIAADNSHRPLAKSQSQSLKLWKSRQESYRKATTSVCANGQADSIANEIEKLVRWPTAKAVVNNAQPYPIYFDSLDNIGESIAKLAPTRCLLVTDSTVGSLYSAQVQDSVINAGVACDVVTFPAGEESKSMETLHQLARRAVSLKLDRHSLVIGLGGGVTGDIAGFLAATLFRGIDVVHIPTTLLAMVDSSVGGKTGINLPEGKNLLGAFWQPKMVWVDIAVLDSLESRHYKAGLGEVLKYGLLSGKELWNDALQWCHGELQRSAIESVIRRCIKYKAWVVGKDPLEKLGLRVLLNLGHTIGHAIEKQYGYGTFLHGEAVGLGILGTLKISHASQCYEVAKQALMSAGLPHELESTVTKITMDAVAGDKKHVGSSLQFIYVNAVGEPEVRLTSQEELVKSLGIEQ